MALMGFNVPANCTLPAANKQGWHAVGTRVRGAQPQLLDKKVLTPHTQSCRQEDLHHDGQWHAFILLLCQFEHVSICANDRVMSTHAFDLAMIHTADCGAAVFYLTYIHSRGLQNGSHV